MDIRKRFGQRVREYREQKGWSQEQLADVSGLHRTYISGIERGVRNPTLTIIYQISIAFNVRLNELLETDKS